MSPAPRNSQEIGEVREIQKKSLLHSKTSATDSAVNVPSEATKAFQASWSDELLKTDSVVNDSVRCSNARLATALGNELAEHEESVPGGMLATDKAKQDTMTLPSTLVEVDFTRVLKKRIRDVSWDTEKRVGD